MKATLLTDKEFYKELLEEFEKGDPNSKLNKKIKTTEELIEYAMVEYSKFHVQSALKTAAKRVKVDAYIKSNNKGAKYKKLDDYESYDLFGTTQMYKADKKSILKSYPLKNIK